MNNNLEFHQDIIDRTFERSNNISSIQCMSGGHQILHIYLGCMVDVVLSNKELYLLKYKIGDINSDLEDDVSTLDIFMMWKYIDKVLDTWLPIAIEYEMYEGIVNLQNLREMY
jgi:hypothetical protein